MNPPVRPVSCFAGIHEATKNSVLWKFKLHNISNNLFWKPLVWVWSWILPKTVLLGLTTLMLRPFWTVNWSKIVLGNPHKSWKFCKKSNQTIVPKDFLDFWAAPEHVSMLFLNLFISLFQFRLPYSAPKQNIPLLDWKNKNTALEHLRLVLSSDEVLWNLQVMNLIQLAGTYATFWMPALKSCCFPLSLAPTFCYFFIFPRPKVEFFAQKRYLENTNQHFCIFNCLTLNYSDAWASNLLSRVGIADSSLFLMIGVVDIKKEIKITMVYLSRSWRHSSGISFPRYFRSMVGDLLGAFVDGAVSNLQGNLARSPVFLTILIWRGARSFVHCQD